MCVLVILGGGFKIVLKLDAFTANKTVSLLVCVVLTCDTVCASLSDKRMERGVAGLPFFLYSTPFGCSSDNETRFGQWPLAAVRAL